MRTAFVLAGTLLPALVWAAPASPDKDDKPASGVESVRQALDRAVTVKIDKQTLAAAVEALHQKMKINIILDAPTIQQQLGFAPDQSPTQVTADFKDVKARAALRNILEPYNLTFAVIGDTIVVTTEDAAAARQMRQRVSVDLNRVGLAEALRQIGRDTATNLIIDARAEKEAKAEVSLQLEDVPLETAVRLLSEMAGLKPVRVGNALFVTKKGLAAAMRNDPIYTPPNAPTSNVYTLPNGAGVNTTIFLGPGQAAFTPVVAPNPPAAVPAPPMSGTGATPPPENKEDK